MSKAISRKSTRNRIKSAKAEQQKPLDVKNVELFQQSKVEYFGECKHIAAFRKDDKDHEDLWIIRLVMEDGTSMDVKTCDACARTIEEEGEIAARTHFFLTTAETAFKRMRQSPGEFVGRSALGGFLTLLAANPKVENVQVLGDPETGEVGTFVTVKTESGEQVIQVQQISQTEALAGIPTETPTGTSETPA
jgi:hypothetical protein